jgi:hypothetical protein
MKLENVINTVIFLILAEHRYGEIEKQSSTAVFEAVLRWNRFFNA